MFQATKRTDESKGTGPPSNQPPTTGTGATPSLLEELLVGQALSILKLVGQGSGLIDGARGVWETVNLTTYQICGECYTSLLQYCPKRYLIYLPIPCNLILCLVLLTHQIHAPLPTAYFVGVSYLARQHLQTSEQCHQNQPPVFQCMSMSLLW